MASPSSTHTTSNSLARHLLAPALLLLAALTLLVACDDSEDSPGDGSPTSTATTTPTATSTTQGSGGGGGSGASSDYDDAYDSAVSMAFDQDIGSDVDDEYLASIDIDIKPNGEGLPEGSGVASQGAEIFASQCAQCHGENGEGGGPAGNGPQVIIENASAWQPDDPKVVGNYWPYATTVYDYIRRAMPFLTPGSLSDEEVYAVTAFLLAENGVIAADEEMNQDTLPQVEMPNRDSFFSCWPDHCRPDVGGDAQEDEASPTATGTPPEEYEEDPTAEGTQ